MYENKYFKYLEVLAGANYDAVTVNEAHFIRSSRQRLEEEEAFAISARPYDTLWSATIASLRYVVWLGLQQAEWVRKRLLLLFLFSVTG